MSAVRTRQIRHEFWLNGPVCAVSRDARFLLIGLCAIADREGRLDGHPMHIRRHVFPLDADMTVERITELLTELEIAGFIARYEYNQRSYVFIPGFSSLQSPHPSEARSKLPPHPNETQLGSHWDPSGMPVGSKLDHSSEPSGSSDPSEPSVDPDRDVEMGVNGKEAETGSRRASPSAKARTSKRRTSLRQDWSPNSGHHAIAGDEGLDVQSEATKFRDHAQATGRVMADWDAAFRTWLRNARRFGAAFNGSAAPKATRTDRIIDAGREALRRVQEAEERRREKDV
jgi:hypothetical protein